MRNRLVMVLFSVVLGACGSKSGTDNGASGGAKADTGVQASGGSSSSGGASGSAGQPGVGGTVGTGGGAGHGGTGTSIPSGSGGATGNGGATGGSTATTGGALGRGGATGSGGGTGSGGASGGSTATTGGATGRGGASGTGGRFDAGPVSDATPVDGPKGSVADAPEAGSSLPQTCPAGQAAPAAGNRKASLQHGGRSRSYVLHVPSGLASGKPLAVVFDLHGATASGSVQQSQSGWGTTADREGFLMVYPDGIDGYWNVDDTCCGTAGSQKIDDIGFMKAIAAQLSKDICIDAKRIYATGISNGGGLAHRIGCDAADVFAAVAPVSTDLRTQPCNPVRPISMMEFRGTGDTTEPYEGGVVGPAGGQYVAVGAKASLKLWADINQCTGTTTTIDKYCESYTACKNDVETDLCSMPGVDHGAYRNSLNFNIPDTAWKMFQRQPMR